MKNSQLINGTKNKKRNPRKGTVLPAQFRNVINENKKELWNSKQKN